MSFESRPPASSERHSAHVDQRISQFVGFRLGDEDYAIAITSIQEIIVMMPITRLPHASGAIEGLINLRGIVIPIVNLRRRFGLPVRAFDDETRTIVVNIQGKTVGCIVDEVTQVMRIAGDQIQPVPITVAATARRYIAGLARLEDRLLIILDIDRLFGRGELELDLDMEPASLPLTSQPHPRESEV
jgi:purine-binding chemotaxis protein CheW